MEKIAFIFVSIFLINCDAQTASTIPTSTMGTTPEPLDASAGGKFGNPGAQLRFSTKALDSIYAHAIDMIGRAIRSMVIPDVIVPLGQGTLTIKNVRVTEAKIGGYERQLLPPNRIRSRLHSGRIVSIGQWQYKPLNGGVQRQISSGLFRTIIFNAEMNVTNQLGRTWDAKAMVQTNDCKAYLGQFRVEIEGFGDNTTVIDQCDNVMCKRIRAYFEDSVCNTARNYIKETINQKLATAPTRVILGPTGNRFVLDYGLLLNEPKVSEQYIQAHLEGEVLSRGSSAAPFYANDLCRSEDDGEQPIISFLLSDYVFNTLLHHVHTQQYRFSAYDLLPASQIRDYLKLQCASPASARSNAKGRSYPGGRQAGSSCLGSVFDNVTISQGSGDGLGDLVFKSQRPLQVILRHNSTVFGVNGGQIEAYGAIGSDGKRELLGRADVQWIRATFTPKMSECNITGSPLIQDLKLAPATPAPIQARMRTMSDPVLSKLTQLSIPVMTEMFKSFFAQFAQFPIPLVEGYACESPELTWTDRTMQVDADVRVLPDATRAKN